jgi:hypothetical protein
MTYQVEKPVSKFAFQMQPAALQRGLTTGRQPVTLVAGRV